MDNLMENHYREKLKVSQGVCCNYQTPTITKANCPVILKVEIRKF